ncbi:hypothetical protein JCM10213_002772 [Rhodosporidiobolus nylandii]
MLDRLPLELLALVLRLSAPLDYSSLLYPERRQTLRICCLVSPRMRELAQPMLPEVFFAEEKEDVELAQVKGENVKLLVLNGAGDQLSAKSGRVQAILEACSQVMEVRLLFVQLDLGCLASLPELRRLIVHGGTLTGDRSDAFPCLAELSLNNLYMGQEVLQHVLTSTTTPRLRAFGMSSINDPKQDVFLSLPRANQHLPKRLFCLAVEVSENPSLADDVLAYEGLLVSCELREGEVKTLLAQSSLPAYIRLTFDASIDVLSHRDCQSVVAALRILSSRLKHVFAAASSPPFRSLFLPTALHPARTQLGELAKAVATLVKACRAADVEAVWPSRSYPAVHDSLTPSWFWKHRWTVNPKAKPVKEEDEEEKPVKQEYEEEKPVKVEVEEKPLEVENDARWQSIESEKPDDKAEGEQAEEALVKMEEE